MTVALVNYSVYCNASPNSFQFYDSGVYYSSSCSSSRLNHGVLVVGYDISSDGYEYWIVKNRYITLL